MNFDFNDFYNSEKQWIKVVIYFFDPVKTFGMFVTGPDMSHKNIKQHLKMIAILCTHLREFCIFKPR